MLIFKSAHPFDCIAAPGDLLLRPELCNFAPLQRAHPNQQIESAFDRDVEDYELEVGSAGLTSPFKVKGQYEKNIGNEIEVLTRDGRKLTGTLQSVSPDGAAFTMTVKEKVKEEGKKRPVIVDRSVEMNVADTRTVRYLLSSK